MFLRIAKFDFIYLYHRLIYILFYFKNRRYKWLRSAMEIVEVNQVTREQLISAKANLLPLLTSNSP